MDEQLCRGSSENSIDDSIHAAIARPPEPVYTFHYFDENDRKVDGAHPSSNAVRFVIFNRAGSEVFRWP